ncbi:MAG: hypothetical protein KJ927_19080 [Candidatus Eisenbacteria bacterium]|nr:hypothetical protein [Candidatus Eisenbacteria bacterium]MBU1950826.1 hypothetical protein [Candidatus Eisenbacteria bacterium]
MDKSQKRHFRIMTILIFTAVILMAALLGSPSPLIAEESSSQTGMPAPNVQGPVSVTAEDNPNDNGHGILIKLVPPTDDESIIAYEIERGLAPGAPDDQWFQVGTVPRGMTEYVYTDEDPSLQGEPNPAYVASGDPIYLRLRARTASGVTSAWTEPVAAIARGNWFHTGKVNILVATLLFGFGVVYFISRARKGKALYVRPIPGLQAVDEAIGRATEMGKPILYVLGTGTASDIATIAGYTILSRVAKRTAEYQTPILVPVNDPVMLAMGQEVVKEAYVQAGRPDVYRPENVSYVSAMQFPYVAAVNGLMLRDRPATCFYMGVFHAESLLLAEAGSVTGAIQISGTDQISQIPFFVAATDYTLIGEELYAASAYLSQEPDQLGPLKAQDYFKVAIVIIIMLGVLSLTLFHWDGILKLVYSPV